MATRVLISGDVQGVGFRWSAAHEAERLGATGSIRNLPDGRVEAIVDEGAGQNELLEWLRRGPPGARVDRVESDAQADTGNTGFRIG
ncbi:MAG: acylphosphatase [Schumannella sp.]|jgi:acylphosphatase|nr:acylphosphatase [Schumannella sp.]